MRIECPSCHAAYQVPDQLLNGRPVRCARCGQEWAPSHPLQAAVPAEPLPGRPGKPSVPGIPSAVEPGVDPMPVPDAASSSPRGPDGPARPGPLSSLPPPFLRPAAAPAPLRRRRAGSAAGWAATAVVLLALAGAAYAFRGAIMQAWPPSARLYAALGLAGSVSAAPR